MTSFYRRKKSNYGDGAVMEGRVKEVPLLVKVALCRAWLSQARLGEIRIGRVRLRRIRKSGVRLG